MMFEHSSHNLILSYIKAVVLYMSFFSILSNLSLNLIFPTDKASLHLSLLNCSDPPFHLIRRGWGVFPVRVQLEFLDKRNKSVDIIHNLKVSLKSFCILQLFNFIHYNP